MAKRGLQIGTGLDDYMAQLTQAGQRSGGDIGRAIYVGGKIVADAVRTEIDALPVDDHFAPPGKKRGVKSIEKAGLQAGLGIAKARNSNGFRNVQIGFHGYNAAKSKTWPAGHPNAMVARSIQKGTSFMRPNQFFTRAVNNSRAAAEAAMKAEFEKNVSEHFK